MVRKQLYLTEAQDRDVKRRARELGLTEAEFVRRAVDRALATPALQQRHPKSAREAALERLLKNADRLAERAQVPAGYKFKREDAYEEREQRWQHFGRE